MPKFLSCIATSVQLGHKRFPDRHERPQIKAWRCDLTALSRSHNFYFVACNDAIHVYQPRFPDQSIPGEPELVLHPPTSSPYLQPGIDPEDSHSITRLHVDYLGQEEIILVTCDDGDVIGYRTEEIQRVMIEQKRQSDCDIDFFLEQPVRTFLHRNVGASAWGLAIHNEARMIAISANTHKVTVVAYALTQPTEAPRCLSSSSDSGLKDCSDEEDLLDFPSPRRQDHTIILPAHHNVPSVSFDNSGDDPSGRWLSSCSINGETLIWDLHNPGKPVRTIRLGYCASVKDPTKAPKINPGTCACLRPSNFPHAIWSTMFLDANTAYEDISLQHLVPPLADHPLPHIRDIGKDRFPFTVMPRKPLAMIVPLNEPLAEKASSEMDVSETDSVASDFSEAMSISSLATTSIVDAQHFEDAEVMTSPLHGSSSASQLSVVPFESTEHTAEATAPSQIMPGSLHQAPHHTLGSAVNASGPWFQPPDQEATTIVWDDIDADTDSDDELFVAPHLGVHAAFASMMQNTRAYCEVVTAFTHARQIKMSSPLLIVTKEDVHLYQRPLDYVGDHSDHIITLRHPLHPEDCQKPFPSIPGSHDRHCYTTQIPELGVFIVASPNGRAGVFSLNRAPDHSPGRPQFSFQLENILPFANSDDSKIWDVEGARLIGVAAGPVQGMLDKEETSGEQEDWSNRFEKKPGSRRWRVMMYYTDHTVLAFELGKRREGEVPEVDELIV